MQKYSKKAAISEFNRRSGAYAACSALMPKKNLEIILGLLHLTGEEKILDAATGTGFFVAALSGHAKEVVGLDISPGMLEHAKIAALKNGLENILYCVGDVETMPFEDSMFDIVTCRFSLHHFPSPAKSLSEMMRVCRGRILIEDMVSSEDPARSYYQNTMERLRDPSHIRHYSISEIMKMLSDQGFEIVAKIEDSSDFAFERWIEIADLSPQIVKELRDMMTASMAGDRAGLNVRFDGQRLVFTYQTVIVMARKI